MELAIALSSLILLGSITKTLSLSFFHGLENSRMRERSAREYTFDLVFLGGKVFLVSSGLDSRAGEGSQPHQDREQTEKRRPRVSIRRGARDR